MNMKIPESVIEKPEEVPAFLDELSSKKDRKKAVSGIDALLVGDKERFWLAVIESDYFCPEDHGFALLVVLNTSEELLALYGTTDPDERECDKIVIGIVRKSFTDPNLIERIGKDYELIFEAEDVREAVADAID